jgi:hypothetical protein
MTGNFWGASSARALRFLLVPVTVLIMRMAGVGFIIFSVLFVPFQKDMLPKLILLVGKNNNAPRAKQMSGGMQDRGLP